MPHVKFYEAFEEEESLLKSILPDSMEAVFTLHTIQEEDDEKPPADIICTRSQSIIPEDWNTDIKGILTRSQGYDHLTRFQKATGSNIPCGYLPSYCERSVAEHAIMIALSLLKKLPQQIRQLETFNRDHLTGLNCLHKKALVVGVGKIGYQIHLLSKAIGMETLGVDLEERHEDVVYTPLQDGIKEANVIFCALPCTNETRGLLNYDLLKTNEQGPVLVNVSRGEVTPTSDMIKLVHERILRGLGLDVYENEAALAGQLRDGHQGAEHALDLLDMAGTQNCILTPHNAFNTEDSLKAKCHKTIGALKYFLDTGSFPDNIPVF